MLQQVLSIFILTLISNCTIAQHIEQSLAGIPVKPFGRIIRTCCNFGYDLPVMGLKVHKDYSTSSELLGKHKFYGDKNEHNGLIYTRDGGFIDIGHLRDNADMVAYFSLAIEKNNGTDFKLNEAREAGKRVIEISLKGRELTSSDILLLAQRITYEMAVWHEIRTYFGVPTYYPIKEIQSAFSPEDLYSNLLGTYVGRWALEKNGPYEQETDTVIQEVLTRLGKVSTEEKTKAAMDNVLGIWWQRVSVPSKDFLLAWNTSAYGEVKPWLIPDHTKFFDTPTQVYPLQVPLQTETGIALDELFTIRIEPISKIPLNLIYNAAAKKEITQKDFPFIINWIERELCLPESHVDIESGSKKPD